MTDRTKDTYTSGFVLNRSGRRCPARRDADGSVYHRRSDGRGRMLLATPDVAATFRQLGEPESTPDQ